MNKISDKERNHAQQYYPGAGTDRADDEKINKKMVKRDIKTLNNNPRNNDIDE